MPNYRIHINDLQFSDYEIETILKRRLKINDRQFFKNGILYERDAMYDKEEPVRYNYRLTPELLKAYNTIIEFMCNERMEEELENQ